jgi:hypothetical protein
MVFRKDFGLKQARFEVLTRSVLVFNFFIKQAKLRFFRSRETNQGDKPDITIPT